MANVVDLKGTIWNAKVYDKITRFTLSVSHKNKQTDEWESGSINCVISNGTYSRTLEDKMFVSIIGNISPNQWQDKENKVHHDIQIWVDNIKFDSKSEKSVMDGFTDSQADTDDEELPFT